MAINLASKYRDMNFKLINFGAPRFANMALRDWVRTNLTNLNAFRFVNKKDFAPRIISRAFGYRHTGHLFQITRRSSAIYYDQIGGNGLAGAPNSWYGKISFLFLLLIIICVEHSTLNTLLFETFLLCYFNR